MFNDLMMNDICLIWWYLYDIYDHRLVAFVNTCANCSAFTVNVLLSPFAYDNINFN